MRKKQHTFPVISIVTIVMVIGLVATAFAMSAPSTSTDNSIVYQQTRTADQDIVKKEIKGAVIRWEQGTVAKDNATTPRLVNKEGAIGTAPHFIAGEMEESTLDTNNSKTAEANTGSSLIVAEHVPKSRLSLQQTGTAAEVRLIVIATDNTRLEGNIPREFTGNFTGAASMSSQTSQM
jgi:hypothetical protein